MKYTLYLKNSMKIYLLIQKKQQKIAFYQKKVRQQVFNSITALAEKDTSSEIPISKKEIEETIKDLKNKRTRDSQGWSNILIKNSGTDIINSLQILYNEIDKQITIPNEWKDLIIKSIYKNKGNKMEMENRRGLFITSTISKIYEKIKLKRNTQKIENILSKYQCGGRKEKSIIDHIMTLNAVIDYNKYINTETYILFADAYKCFDKLNLKDCINDYYNIVGSKEAIRIYEMNKKGKAVIKTPIGEVGPIKADEIVRQGTIMGPKLCCINTDKINIIGHDVFTAIGPNIKVKTLIYVDDIQNASSSIEGLEKAVRNCRILEETKGYTFNTDPKKTAILIVDKKKNKTYDNIKLEIKKGKIEQTKEYKYLGEWYNEKGKSFNIN